MILRIISIVVALIAFVTYSSLFVVDERQKALVLQTKPVVCPLLSVGGDFCTELSVMPGSII